MSHLEEDKAKSSTQIAEAQAETEKREERLRTMATKVCFWISTICHYFSVWTNPP